ncbi:MAG: hypothetical protein ACXWHA_12910, partial [Usitatibacter sp.]
MDDVEPVEFTLEDPGTDDPAPGACIGVDVSGIDVLELEFGFVELLMFAPIAPVVEVLPEPWLTPSATSVDESSEPEACV